MTTPSSALIAQAGMTGDQIAFVGMVMMVIIAAVLVVGLIHGWKHH